MEKSIMFDDVIYTEYLNGFNFERRYLGATDENGREDITNALGCIISLSETEESHNNQPETITDLFKILAAAGFIDNTSIEQGIIYNTAPLTVFSLVIEDYDSETTTEQATNIIYQYFKDKEDTKTRAALAQRIIDLDPWEARNAEATPATVAEDIKNNPAAVIAYLLDFIDNIY